MDNLEYLKIVSTATLIIIFLIMCLRICGLRSFSKMTGFDFAITIAVGTLMASPIINSKVSLIKGFVAIATLFTIQFFISYCRKQFKSFANLIDNNPRFLYKDGEFIDRNMLRTRTTKADIFAKLREANATDISKVSAVILESTGDISVLHGDNRVDPQIYEGVLS